MKRNRFNRRFEEDVWGLITVKAKDNKVTRFFQSLYKEKNVTKNKKTIVYRVEVTKPKRRKLVLSKFGQLLAYRRKLCEFYGGLRKKDLVAIIRKVNLKKENLSDGVVTYLESRLETVVYRMNFVSSIREGRKEITRGMFMVNRVVVKAPSYRVKVGDIVEVVPKEREKVYKQLKRRLENSEFYTTMVSYLEVNYKILAGVLIDKIKFSQVPYPFKITDKFFKGFILGKE